MTALALGCVTIVAGIAFLMALGCATLVQQLTARLDVQRDKLVTALASHEVLQRHHDEALGLMRQIAEQNAKLAHAQGEDRLVLHGALQMLGVELQALSVTKH